MKAYLIKTGERPNKTVTYICDDPRALNDIWGNPVLGNRLTVDPAPFPVEDYLDERV